MAHNPIHIVYETDAPDEILIRESPANPDQVLLATSPGDLVVDGVGPGGHFELGSGWLIIVLGGGGPDASSAEQFLAGSRSAKLPLSLGIEWAGDPVDMLRASHSIHIYHDKHLQSPVLPQTDIDIRVWSSGSGPFQPSSKFTIANILNPIGPFDRWTVQSWADVDWIEIFGIIPMADLTNIVKARIQLVSSTPLNFASHVSTYIDQWGFTQPVDVLVSTRAQDAEIANVSDSSVVRETDNPDVVLGEG